LSEKLSVTTLWRIFNNFADHLSPHGIENIMAAPVDEELHATMEQMVRESIVQDSEQDGYNFITELRTKEF
jgi:hypothetical protein